MKSLLEFLLCLAFLHKYSMGRVVDQQIDQSFPAICRNRNGVTAPMAGSCTGFFICVDGHAIASSCGNFYHFNARTGLCEHPLKAACSSNKSLIRDAVPATRLITRSSLPKPKTPNEVIADLSAGPICRNQLTGIILPKSDSCTQYYVCILQRPFRRTCPPMLHFNATRGLCQDPVMAQCVIPFDNKQEMPANKRKVINYSKEASLDTGIIKADTDYSNVEDICATSSDGTVFPYPGDCGRFIFCVHHQVLTLICPEGYHFSRRNGRCEWPAVAECRTLS
ncbi:probable chitinase 10 isoform X1 [Anastrepha ludens]|uniref:probable chitinase 10 isoform X1 n=1 Tax=Anastrepha ludens TaxID=28586 RepID=UPI0023B095B6|nr:probable chitinase 10 isoform X1 [Anastrepha ludens]